MTPSPTPEPLSLYNATRNLLLHLGGREGGDGLFDIAGLTLDPAHAWPDPAWVWACIGANELIAPIIRPAPDLAALAVVIEGLGWESMAKDQPGFHMLCPMTADHQGGRMTYINLKDWGWSLTFGSGALLDIRWTAPGSLPRLLLLLAALAPETKGEAR